MMGLLVSKAFDTVLIANEANAAYLCGENPNPLDTMRAARMENWSTVVRRRGKEFVLVVIGDVYKQAQFEDGQNIQTSAVIWFECEARFALTFNRLYALGQPVGAGRSRMAPTPQRARLRR